MMIVDDNIFIRFGEVHMKTAKKILLILISAVMIGGGGCRVDKSETSKNVVYKQRDEIEEDVKTYLREKYGKEFVVAVTDSPNHIYSSYEASAYAADDENKEMFELTVYYADKEHYSITDDYFMYSISDDLEVWFKELADPYINCEYKVYWRPAVFPLSNDYDQCKTVEDFLELSPTASYYALRFIIVLPSQAADSDIDTMTDSIAAAMLEKRIRGQVTTIVYVDEVVYDQINSKKSAQHFWSHNYKNIFCTSTIKSDFSFRNAKIQKGGFWNLDDETYNKEILNDN